MNGLDFIIILILIASVIYSIFRGFVREVFSLISIILGFMAAIRLYSFPAHFLHSWISSLIVANILGFILIFITIKLIVGLFGGLIRRFIRFIRGEAIDKILGAVFGLLKGVFGVTMMILILIAFLPPAPPILTKSRLTPYFITLGELSINMIPVNLKQTVREKKESLSLYWNNFPGNQLKPENEKGVK